MKKKSSVNKAGNYANLLYVKEYFSRLMNSASYGTAVQVVCKKSPSISTSL